MLIYTYLEWITTDATICKMGVFFYKGKETQNYIRKYFCLFWQKIENHQTVHAEPLFNTNRNKPNVNISKIYAFHCFLRRNAEGQKKAYCLCKWRIWHVPKESSKSWLFGNKSIFIASGSRTFTISADDIEGNNLIGIRRQKLILPNYYL